MTALANEIRSGRISTVHVWAVPIDEETFGLLSPNTMKKQSDCAFDVTLTDMDRDFLSKKLMAGHAGNRPLDTRRVLAFRDANGNTIHELALGHGWIDDDTVDALLDGQHFALGVGFLTYVDYWGRGKKCAP